MMDRIRDLFSEDGCSHEWEYIRRDIFYPVEDMSPILINGKLVFKFREDVRGKCEKCGKVEEGITTVDAYRVARIQYVEIDPDEMKLVDIIDDEEAEIILTDD